MSYCRAIENRGALGWGLEETQGRARLKWPSETRTALPFCSRLLRQFWNLMNDETFAMRFSSKCSVKLGKMFRRARKKLPRLSPPPRVGKGWLSTYL